MAKKGRQIDPSVLHDSCVNCRFWRRLDDDEQIPSLDVIGECRRYPPAVFELDKNTDDPIQALPETLARFWCGEHGRSIT